MDYESFSYNPIVEKITNILCTKTQNANDKFFRLQTNYYLSLVASVMGTRINSKVTGNIPVNFYGINLAQSGAGKGFSTNLLENQIIGLFRQQFMQEIFPKMRDSNIAKEAIRRAAFLGISTTEAEDKLIKECRSYGAYKFGFDSATSPAIKQLRNLLLISKVGAINLSIDEIGSNLQNNTEALTTFLELYDKGIVKDKLTKNTETSIRHLEMVGETPANMALFGTPSKLLDGGKTEDDFFSFLETGYARRCFFAYSKKDSRIMEKTAEELYEQLTSSNQEKDIDGIAMKLFHLADLTMCNTVLDVPKDVDIALVQYRIDCEKRASELPEYMEIQKAELSHRYFKALKLAGAYAFLDMATEISLTHLEQAIKFAEDSGNALNQILQREKPYERLAKFIADNDGKELTQVDLTNQLPFYKGSQAAKTEMLSLATAWGYKNNIIIKRSFKDNIEFISGESLKETDLDKMILAYSKHWTESYYNDRIPFKHFVNMVKTPDLHWVNHHLENGYRSEDNVITGFNCVVLDVDGTAKLDVVKELLKDYTYVIHTTKRHQQLVEVSDGVFTKEDRFRIILPTNYCLDLNKQEYKEFMQNVAEWCPFEGLDEQTFHPSRKWACYDKGEVFYNEGILFDVLPFIPRTSRAEEYKRIQLSMQSMDNLERWFAQRMQHGSRNNTLSRYGFLLADSGMSLDNIRNRLLEFNSKLENSLDESEILSTVMVSIENRRKKEGD